MSGWLEENEDYALRVITGEEKGFFASLLRGGLRLLSWIYGAVMTVRVALFEKFFKKDHQTGCLVISVGNLTVGGTGKTPAVEMLSKSLRAGGRRVVILSRGYRSEPLKRPQELDKPEIETPPWAEALKERLSPPPKVVTDGNQLLLDSARAGDEPYMLAKNLQDIPIVVDRDRVKGALFAINHFGADTLVLDDGLQYLKLKRRLDLVLIDRTAPFGTGGLLPRGTLREPKAQLRRASYILITKCDGSSNEALIRQIRKYNATAPIGECRHEPLYLESLEDGSRLPLSDLQGKRIGCLSGIAQPKGFEISLEKMGAIIVDRKRFPDHHRFRSGELQKFIQSCHRKVVDYVVTTEKDAVRFPRMDYSMVPVYFLRIEIRMLKGAASWEEFVRRVCEPKAVVHPPKLYW